ncbi:tRNA 2-thiouridine(34) synthase MnmA [Blattabacterium cuenoti]|uniref:tRNA 2-thiouridine(34) synthase MnmA n=1 Tax=Blattabacterium cuenoti TaxID=1653831 RepID=UPI00163C6C33|nr:tRNA 2-thiouridine(34) synthase MnmA [Blattabacterium cuenoti]
MKKIVVVALSGGVDSSVAALILKKRGYKVIGLFMHNWEDPVFNCTWEKDSIDAMLSAYKLNIPFQIIEMKNEYKKYVINYMYEEYEKGKTPNPDIVCNRIIKFNLFLKIAINSLGADCIATGHYVRKKEFIKNNKKIYRLLIGKDLNKDQSYFLCQLNQYQLEKSIFPIGDFTKKEVRKIAKLNGLYNAFKKESQGLCFVGKIQLPKFLQRKINPKKGKIICIDSNSDIYKKNNQIIHFYKKKLDNFSYLKKKIYYKESDGKLIGHHNGAYLFTKGQRKGISIGGFKKALFVIDTDIKTNIVYTGLGINHPGLYSKYLFIKDNDVHWIRNDIILNGKNKMNVFCRIRHRQPLQKSILHNLKNGILIEFYESQRAITEGQFAAWYINKELIGSGIIS